MIITIANNCKNTAKLWEKRIIKNKRYSLSLCWKFLTSYFFNGLIFPTLAFTARGKRLRKTVLEAESDWNRLSAYPFARKVSCISLLKLGNLLSFRSKLLEMLCLEQGWGEFKVSSISFFNLLFENCNNNRNCNGKLRARKLITIARNKCYSNK